MCLEGISDVPPRAQISGRCSTGGAQSVRTYICLQEKTETSLPRALLVPEGVPRARRTLTVELCPDLIRSGVNTHITKRPSLPACASRRQTAQTRAQREEQ